MSDSAEVIDDGARSGEARPRSGPQSIYLVDFKLTPGFVSRLPLQGNSIFLAGNGGGKTSRMLLLPFFLGSEPSAVVSRGKEDTFDEFYLPRTTSHLAMDYINGEGQARCVVVYMAGQRLVYRFVDSFFDRDWVVNDGKLLPGNGLAKRLLELGVPFNQRQIETTREYRSIIQGVPDRHSPPNYRHLRRSYSIAGSRRSLAKIDRIIAGMISKTVKFPELQSIVLACIEADEDGAGGDPGALMNQLSNIDELVSEGEALERTQEVIDSFAAAEEAYTELEAARIERRRLRSSVALSLPKYEGRLEKLAAERKTLEERERSERERADQAISSLKGTREQFEREARDTRRALEDLKNEWADWESRDVSGMEWRASKNDANKQKLKAELARKALMDSAAKEVGDQAMASRDALRRACSERIAAAMQAYSIATQANTREQARLAQRQKEETDELTKETRSRLQPLRDAEVAARDAHQFVRGRVPGPTDEMLSELAQAQLIADTERDSADVADSALRRVEATIDEQQRRAEKLLSDRDRLRVDRKRLEQRIQSIHEQIDVDATTLRAFLEVEVPDWESTLGKVLKPELLARTDLQPERVDSGTSIYGVELETSGVPPAESTDALARSLEAAQDQLRECAEAGRALGAEIDAVARSNQELRKERDSASVAARDARARYSNSANELRSLKSAHTEQVNRQRREHASDVERAEAEWREAHRALLTEEINADTDSDELTQRYLLARTAIDARTHEAENRRAEEEAAAKSKLEVHLRQVDDDERQRLKAKGLDENLQLISQSIDSLRAAIRQVDVESELLREWLQFSSKYEQRVSELQSLFEKKEFDVTQLTESIETQEIERERLLEGIRKQIRACKTRFDRLETDARSIRSLLKVYLADVDDDPEGAAAFEDPSRLITEINRVSQSVQERSKQLSKLYVVLRSAFISKQASKVAQAWRNVESAVGDYSSVRSFLLEWYGVRLGRAQDGHLNHLFGLKQAIDHFAFERQRFHDNVARFNGQLRRAMQHIRVSSAIERLELNIATDSRDSSFTPVILQGIAEQQIDLETLASNTGVRESFVANVRKLRKKLADSRLLSMTPQQMISISGQVYENGRKRVFDRTSDMNDLSSAGLSTLIQSAILMGFFHLIRGDAPVDLVWCLDELATIDGPNTDLLIRALNERHISLLTAQPSAMLSPAVFKHFKWVLKPTAKGNIIPSEVRA